MAQRTRLLNAMGEDPARAQRRKPAGLLEMCALDMGLGSSAVQPVFEDPERDVF